MDSLINNQIFSEVIKHYIMVHYNKSGTTTIPGSAPSNIPVATPGGPIDYISFRGRAHIFDKGETHFFVCMREGIELSI